MSPPPSNGWKERIRSNGKMGAPGLDFQTWETADPHPTKAGCPTCLRVPEPPAAGRFTVLAQLPSRTAER